MRVYTRHLFVCTACSPRAQEIIASLKEKVKASGLHEVVRVNAAGCLRQCDRPIQAVVYPEGTWYGDICADDIEELFTSHLVAGVPIERLLLQNLEEQQPLSPSTEPAARTKAA